MNIKGVLMLNALPIFSAVSNVKLSALTARPNYLQDSNLQDCQIIGK
jgi:hypothetical protein